jgi:hypothetical protein
MAVTYFDQTFSSGVKTSVDDKGWTTATAQIKWNAFVSTPSDTELTVRLDPRCPRERLRHPLFGGLYCNGVDVSRRGPVHFEVTADFTSPQYKEANGEQQGPLAQPTQVSFFTITSEEEIDEDFSGYPIVTACGEPVMGITRPISDLGVRLQKNFASFDPASFYTFIDCVNSDTFIGFSPGVLRIASISADEQFFTDSNGNSIPFWSVQVEIHARKPYRTTAAKSWWKRYRHEGFYIKSGNKIVRATDDNKEPVSQPVQLAANGTKLSDQTQSTWVERQVFAPVNFASMGF